MTVESPEITAELLGRLNTRGPRYTSYPTALHFTDDVGEEEIRRVMLTDTGAAERPVSLYVHVPYCKKLCWYCACHKTITRDASKGAEFVDVLIKEMVHRAPLLSGRTVKQVHFGGGTPTFLAAVDLTRVMMHMRALYTIDEGAEISIEIDPRTCTPEHIEALAVNGFTRTSLGIQDTDERVQEAINRIQPMSCILDCVHGLRAVGIEHINLDLIYGLPNQTLETIAQTLDDIAQFEPNRLAIYGYAHVPWAHPAQKLLERGSLPSSDARLEMLAFISETLKDRGYVHIGMDHYARPDDTLAMALDEGSLQRNFQGYSTKKGVDIHGFGPSAISAVPGFYAQNQRDMSAWTDDVNGQKLPIERGVLCDEEDVTRREIIMELMCRRVIDVEVLAKKMRIDDFESRFAHELSSLRQWESEGLVHMTKERIEVTHLGRHFLRNLAMCFDAYLGGETTRYSRTV